MKHTLLAVFTALCAVASTAQSLVDEQRDAVKRSHKVISLSRGELAPDEVMRSDSIRELLDMFYLDQFRSFSDPEAPYFLFMSRDATLAMGIGGAVRMRAYYDWNGAIPSPGFAPYLIPMNPDPTKMRHFGTTPSGTCLFFRVIGRNKRLGHYQLYIEANFTGYQSRDFKLKKAYAVINDFTIGYDVSSFSDPAALPPMVDAQGPSNKIAPSTVLVRYMPRLAPRWVFAVSAETPATMIDSDGTHAKAIDNWVPDGAAFIQYEWGRSSHVRVGGIVRSLSYRDLTTSTNHYRAGWGVMLSSVAHPLPQMTSYVTVNYGRGYASLGGDLSIAAFDLIPDPDVPGRLYSPATLGWCVGLQWNFRPNLFVGASVSQSRLYPKDNAVSPDQYKHGLMASVNCFWNLTPRIQVGAEFDYGRRTDFSSASRHACRVGAMTMFSF